MIARMLRVIRLRYEALTWKYRYGVGTCMSCRAPERSPRHLLCDDCLEAEQF